MTKIEKLELHIKALELAVDLLKATPKFTNKDILKLTCYFYDFLKNKINRVVETNCENYLVIGDTIGHMYLVDKRKSMLVI